MAVTQQLKLLISLAQIDGRVADLEKNFIRNIGRANGSTDAEIDPLFDQRHAIIVPSDLTPDQKFHYIFSLVQLMKIDERMFREEILFCSKVASRLGYDQQVMFDLMLHVKSVVMGDDEIESLQELTRKYLS